MTREILVTGFWLAGNTTFFSFSFFFGMETVLIDDREENGPKRRCSLWKTTCFLQMNQQYFTAVSYTTH